MFIQTTSLAIQNINVFDYLNILKKNKLKYCEISSGLLNINDKKQIDLVKKKLKKNNIKINVMQSVFYNFKMEKKYESDLDFFYSKSIEHFDKIIKLCNIFHIPKISLGNIPTRKLRLNEKKISYFNSKTIKKFLSLCKRNNIELCLEPISKKFNCNFLNDTKQTVKFINNFNDQNLKLLFDTGNVEENNQNVVNLLKKNLGIIEHIQIRSKDPKNYSLNKIKQLLDLLEKNNYKKTITIEYFSKKNFYKLEKLIIFLKNNYNTYI